VNYPTPPWIEITTVFPCAVGCYYCPQAVLQQAYKGIDTLTLDSFKTILGNIPKEVLIDFAGFAEPFLNPGCAEMITHAYKQGYRLAMNSTLTGATDADIDRIEHIPFEYFHYHDVNLDGRAVPFEHVIGRVDRPSSRAGNLYAVARRDYQGVCRRSVDHRVNVMLPNGDVYLCCCDYGLKHKLGNLLTTNYNDLSRAETYELCHFCEDYLPND
jgi:hypothetical protein